MDALIVDILNELGFDSLDELLEAHGYDSVVPGICTKCRNVYDVEPDCTDGLCTDCGSPDVQSFLIILGLI